MSILKEDWNNFDFSGLEMNEKEEKYGVEHPSVYLKEDFLDPLGWKQKELAKHLEVDESRVSGILRGERSISVNTALRLEKLFGVSTDYWLRLQQAWDISQEKEKHGKEIEHVRRLEMT